ncbi:MAG TPA: hypothetical protein VIY48_14210 [Candidatus Paceibacterota bacterium]
MYKIVRHYQNAAINHRTIATGLTLKQAQEWCNNPETSSSTCTNKVGKARTRRIGAWFDAHTEQK